MNILFPSFITLNKKDNKSYIYYFRGLTENNKFIYQSFNEDELPVHEKISLDDGALIYIFNSIIKEITCNLISNIEGISNTKYRIKDI